MKNTSVFQANGTEAPTAEHTRLHGAVWAVRHRWVVAILLTLVPVALTAVGSAAGQVLALDEVSAVWLIAAAVTVSAAIGLVVMRASGQKYRAYGFRRAVNARTAWWFLPLIVTVLFVFATSGVAISSDQIAAYAALTIAVAINEETWFRGIVIALIRPAGVRTAVIGSAAIFGILHLSNLAGGADLGASLLQVLFAVLFGVIAAEMALLTGSLWPAIAWHCAWDFTSYVGGNSSIPLALAGVGAACAVMLVYAVLLWKPTLRVAS